jgi:hypothetical protein
MQVTGLQSHRFMKVKTILATSKLTRFLLAAATAVTLAGCGGPVATSNASNPSPSPDVSAARAAAITIFYTVPGQTPAVWLPCSARAENMADCPFTSAVKDRLNALSAAGFGSDVAPGCGEEYITATQNGLFTEPQVLSATPGAHGAVTVVIARGLSPNMTATMTLGSGTWLASDLASGTGPSASIFSAKPNC